ncbi:MAG: fumarylacetoacetate hydrolase family protein [Candidatus Thorarchaeota archaeon]|nr:fumarylacetoacetate hydrolase family protein [Candidatus Thorarchaeota archaeon]
MHLVSYAHLGDMSIGIIHESNLYDIPMLASQYGLAEGRYGRDFPRTMIELLRWPDGVSVVQDLLVALRDDTSSERVNALDLSEVKILAPIIRPGKIIALGLNYKSHIQETGREVPEFPVIFAKFPSAVVHPEDDIPYPSLTRRLDWEVELGVVIGKTCKQVSSNDALDYVAGYTIINDLSARDLQKRDGQWVRAKSLDGFCPMGPVIVTTDELGDGSGLRLYSKINGTIKQDSTTSDLLFDVPHIIEYLSQAFTLEPGDVIATGTPSGVGFARDPPEYLQPGDEMDLFIEKIGHLRNRIVESR